jgi:membrane protease YdiL (CAAX protease family)
MLFTEDRFTGAISGDVRLAEPREPQSRTKFMADRNMSWTLHGPYYNAGRPVIARMAAAGRDAERLIALEGRIAVRALSLLSVYTLLLSALPQFMPTVNFAISPLIIAMFAAAMAPAILSSGFPRSFFGLQTENWKSALAFSVLVSLAFIAAAAALKLVVMHTTETFSSCSLIRAADVRENMHQVRISSLYWVAAGFYLVLAPVQEFVVRCCLQAPLYALLSGSLFWRRAWSILVSNLVFAAAHTHISIAFAFAAFIPGLLWGWIFARTNSLFAAALSHCMIGGAGIFLFGIEGVIAKLVGVTM